MTQEIVPGVYRLEIPIPNNPLKALNSYVITGGARPLIVDAGLNRAECLAAMREQLASLGLKPEQADFFITHMHADHSGAVGELAGPGSTIYASREDGSMINRMGASGEHWHVMKQYALRCGFPEAEADAAIKAHPGFKFGNRTQLVFTEVQDKAVITAGRYELHCLETPGHTRGHTCLYEPRHRILFSGDHVLPGITPNISTWSEGENPLVAFIQSLDKVAGYPVDLFLPGHRWGSVNCHVRIEELKRHHEARSQDILQILQEQVLNPYQVASRMRWDLSYKSWEQFPPPQKWFAAGEAVAHLQFLESEGKITRLISAEGLLTYQLRET